MPYLTDTNREEVENNGFTSASTAGELNYILTKVIMEYMMSKGLSYQTCNDIVGALDNTKDEFRTRIQHPYERRKRIDNGDVYYTLLERFRDKL